MNTVISINSVVCAQHFFAALDARFSILKYVTLL